jgi:hypothetical protein
VDLLMNLLTTGGRWSYHIINENNNYSIWCMNKISICWPKVENFKTMWKCHLVHVFLIKEIKPMEGTFNLLVDLDGPSPTCEVHNYKNGIQVPLYLANILSLSHLHARKIKGK